MSDQPLWSMWNAWWARTAAVPCRSSAEWWTHRRGVGRAILWTDRGGRAPHWARVMIFMSRAGDDDDSPVPQRPGAARDAVLEPDVVGLAGAEILDERHLGGEDVRVVALVGDGVHIVRGDDHGTGADHGPFPDDRGHAGRGTRGVHDLAGQDHEHPTGRRSHERGATVGIGAGRRADAVGGVGEGEAVELGVRRSRWGVES